MCSFHFSGSTPAAGGMERSLLYQSTHSRVASSTSESERHGPSRWIFSVLNRPIVVSAKGSTESPDQSRGLVHRPAAIRSDDQLSAAPVRISSSCFVANPGAPARARATRRRARPPTNALGIAGTAPADTIALEQCDRLPAPALCVGRAAELGHPTLRVRQIRVPAAAHRRDSA